MAGQLVLGPGGDVIDPAIVFDSPTRSVQIRYQDPGASRVRLLTTGDGHPFTHRQEAGRSASLSSVNVARAARKNHPCARWGSPSTGTASSRPYPPACGS